jgi:hypothetical protein
LKKNLVILEYCFHSTLSQTQKHTSRVPSRGAFDYFSSGAVPANPIGLLLVVARVIPLLSSANFSAAVAAAFTHIMQENLEALSNSRRA